MVAGLSGLGVPMGICKHNLMRKEAEKQGRIIFPELCSQLRGQNGFCFWSVFSTPRACHMFPDLGLFVCLFLRHTHHALIPAMMQNLEQ